MVRRKHDVVSPQALLNKMKLIMGCEDPHYNISMADSPNMGDRMRRGI